MHPSIFSSNTIMLTNITLFVPLPRKSCIMLSFCPTFNTALRCGIFVVLETVKNNQELVNCVCTAFSRILLSVGRIEPRMKLAALYSATKSLQNSCTAKLQLFSSILEAKQQLHSSCSGMQKHCAAFEGSLKFSAAVLQRSCRLSNAAK